MLNKQTSRKRNLWKLGLVLPALALFMYSFNTKEVIEYREVASTLEGPTTPSKESNTVLGEEVSLNIGNANKTEALTNEVATSTTRTPKQFTITNTATDAYLKSIETHFAKTFKSTLVRFAKVNHINDKLVSFEFQTKMANDSRFFTRFSVANTENFNPFNLIPVAEHEILMADVKGTQIKITPEQSVSSFSIKESMTNQESMGKNPMVVINGEIAPTTDGVFYETDQGITALLPSKAMALYGNKAKDGAIVIDDPNYTTKVDEKYIKTSNNQTFTNEVVTASPFKVRITKNTTDQELKDIKKDLKENHDVEIDYNVTRNNSDEIVGLNIKYKTSNNNTGNYSINGKTPIREVYIFEDEDGRTGVGNAGSQEEMRKQMEERRAMLQERYKQMEQEHKERQEEMETIREEHEERRQELEERVEKRSEIQQQKMIERQEALEEKRAVLEEKREEMMEVRQNALEEKRALLEEKREVMNEVRQKALKEKRMMMEQKRKEMHQRRESAIATGYNVSNQKLFITSSPNGITTNANRGGVITNTIEKNTTDAGLKEIQAAYAADGVKFSYKGLKRNKQGEIIAITLKLSDKKNKTSSTFKSNTNAISRIYIGYIGNRN